MYQGLKIGVVIPCYHVEASIAHVVEAIPDYVDVVLAVHDASPDGTLARLREIRSPRLEILDHPHNQGVGGAMATGFARAIELNLDIVVKLDGDGQMDPQRMIDLIEPLAEGICDYAKGNRFLHSQSLRRMPFTRKIGNIMLTFLTKLASGYWQTFDPQNGYLAIHSEFLRMLNLDKLRTRRYFFENEMLIQLNIFSARVLDCPMPSIYGDEKSSLRISRILLYFPLLLMRGFFSRHFHRYVLRDFSVVVPLYLAGSVSFLWGLIFGLKTWYEYGTAQIPAPTGSIMLSVLPLILGVQMLLQGLLFEILQTPKPDRSPPRHLKPKPSDNEPSDKITGPQS